MEYKEINGEIKVYGVTDFSLEQSFDCGQCFRAFKVNGDTYATVAYGKNINIQECNGEYTFYPCNSEDFEKIWIPYFDLERDYGVIKEVLSSKDAVMGEAVKYAPGIRLLRQEFFECLISYIISQNSSIPKIKNVINRLCERYGTKLSDGVYAFPDLHTLSELSVSDFRDVGAGFRDKYIHDACRVLKEGELGIDCFHGLTSEQARDRLMEIKGVGVKVADCVTLFALQRFDLFPTDVWVRRIMGHFYFDGREPKIDEIHSSAKEKFGEYAGFAQEYLFYYARKFKIGK